MAEQVLGEGKHSGRMGKGGVAEEGGEERERERERRREREAGRRGASLRDQSISWLTSEMSMS